MKLDGKVAIVTGGSGGIGAGICLALAKEGADILLTYDRNASGASKVVQQIEALGRKAASLQVDVAKSSDVARLMEHALKTFGKVDILVNCAGIFIRGAMENVREEDWDRVFDVNVKGTFLCSQAVGRHMIKAGSGGRIVNVASIAGKMPEIDGGAYTPSKAAVLGLTGLLAMEWAKYGIRVNSLSPGPIMTSMQRAAYPSPALLDARNRAIPLGRHGSPEEMGSVVVFLASDDSSFLTGADIAADGGSAVSMYHLVRQMASKD